MRELDINTKDPYLSFPWALRPGLKVKVVDREKMDSSRHIHRKDGQQGGAMGDQLRYIRYLEDRQC